MQATDPKKVSNEQAIPNAYNPEKDAAEYEDYPDNGNESITEAETDSSDLEWEPLDDEDEDL